MTVRSAAPHEVLTYKVGAAKADADDELTLVYLVELDQSPQK
jgi:hypothetical protein